MRFKTGIAIAAVAVIAAACTQSQGGPPGGGQGMPPTAVSLAVAEAKPIEDTTEYVATLKSLRSTTIQPQIDGQITQIFVKSGDSVKQGAPLMQIDPRRQQAAVSSQEAERASKEANVSFARQQHQRASELFKAGAISKQELEQAETALSTAEAALRSLQAQVQQQRVQLRYFTIAAPTSGTVGDVPVRVGHQVSPQTVLTSIEQNDNLEVYVSVPVERAGDLKTGLPLRVMSGDGRETLAMTTVGFVSSSVDEATQSILVKGRVANPDGKLRSSQFVRARIVWKTEEGLVVPVTAVGRISGQHYVFVAEEADGKLVARQRIVKLAPIVGDDYPVLDGIKPGERIVVSGSQKLREGAPIAPAGASPAPAK
ncbi:MAG: efflux RND transporter periplasmic adaptor subunit [Acidobacteria bacterium]|nr:efflux RND transporter periplasmic adaptor subunit [Acidobacteriota bacterium]